MLAYMVWLFRFVGVMILLCAGFLIFIPFQYEVIGHKWYGILIFHSLFISGLAFTALFLGRAARQLQGELIAELRNLDD